MPVDDHGSRFEARKDVKIFFSINDHFTDRNQSSLLPIISGISSEDVEKICDGDFYGFLEQIAWLDLDKRGRVVYVLYERLSDALEYMKGNVIPQCAYDYRLTGLSSVYIKAIENFNNLSAFMFKIREMFSN